MSGRDGFIAFMRKQAPGAWPNGSKVLKANSEPGDATPDGTAGTVVGSIDVKGTGAASFAYFVEWEDKPGLPVFVADTSNDGAPRLVLVGARH